ncbi:MAG: PilN domain-containing protein [Actinomycetota bacterium]|nr:PilN domain-containing protein [Actinomycetota bacterium]
MTRVNLLPPEYRERAKTRRQTVMAAVAGAAVVAIIVFAWVLQGFTESRLNRDLAAQDATNAQLQQQVNELQHFATQRTELQNQETLLAQALANTVSWSGVLHDLSLVIPDRAWITSVTGSISATGAATEPGVVPAPQPVTGPALIGTIQFQGQALDTETLALWLTRLEQVKGWVNAWISQASEGTVGTTPVFQFASSIDLTSKVAIPGGQL